MEKFGFENKEKFGKNVEVHAFFLRHGEKEVSVNTAETGLTKNGRKKSFDFGQDLTEKSAIKSFASDTKRTKETAEFIIKASATDKKMQQRISQELAFRSSEGSPFYQRVMKIKKETLGEDYNNLDFGEQQARMQKCCDLQADEYLSYKNNRPDAETFSPVETAAMIARRVGIYSEMADKLYSASKVDLINVTHDFNILAFLKEVMVRNKGDERIVGFDNVENIGGATDYLGGFEVFIRIDDQGKKEISLIFQGKKYEIDQLRLAELILIAKKIESENIN